MLLILHGEPEDKMINDRSLARHESGSCRELHVAHRQGEQ